MGSYLMTKHDHPSTTALSVNDLHKDYQLGNTRLAVLKGLNINVSLGEMVAIMGPSGSGKTTLLNCISGLDIPDQGTVSINGNAVELASENARTLLRRHQIGIVFQFFNLIPTLTVQENIGLPFLIAKNSTPKNQKYIDHLIDMIGLNQRNDHYPFQLSGGEMQLVSIARALVHRPSLVLADEPTGNVNPRIGRSIMEILRKTTKKQNTSVLMVTHSPEHASWADRICFLKEGVIVDELKQLGQHDEVSAIYNKLMNLEI